jgi:hypothetical protein
MDNESNNLGDIFDKHLEFEFDKDVSEYSNGAPTLPLFIFFISLLDDLRKLISKRIRPRSIKDSLYSCHDLLSGIT